MARGGPGGAGNRRFARPTQQAPRIAEVGWPGEQAAIELRLKLLADAALLGFPNAGKSSLLRRISNAKPKVADYPFTTIAPVLGTVDAPDGRQLTVADVPGLLEGAHEGVGLGDEFLAHLERARLFLHVIDVTEEAAERFATIDRELRGYGAGLDRAVADRRPQQDRPPRRAAELRDRRSARPRRASPVGSHGSRGRRARCARSSSSCPMRRPSSAAAEEVADFLVYRPRPERRRPFRLFRTDGGYRVRGQATEDELRAAGVKPGDPVEFE